MSGLRSDFNISYDAHAVYVRHYWELPSGLYNLAKLKIKIQLK